MAEITSAELRRLADADFVAPSDMAQALRAAADKLDEFAPAHQRLQLGADLTLTSFDTARALLGGPDPLTCVVYASAFNAAALREIEKAVHAVPMELPEGMLKSPRTWCVECCGRTVWSEGAP